MIDLSKKFGMNDAYLRDISNQVTKKLTTYFRLLTVIYRSDPNKFNLVKVDDYENIKKEMHDEVFFSMKRMGIVKDEAYRLDFDATFYSILVLTEVKKRSSDLTYGMYPLSKFGEDMGYDEKLFTQKFHDGTHIMNSLADAMMYEINIPGVNPDLYKLAQDKLKDIKVRNGEGSENDYHRFWKELYPIQVVELLKITLGLDIWGSEFFEDAKLDKKTYKIDIERHHLERIKSLYTIFRFSKEYLNDPDKFTKEKPPIPFENFLIALAPFMNAYHTGLHHSTKFTSDTQLAMMRLMHLYEVIQRPFIEGFDYKNTLLAEFKANPIWEDLDDGKIKDWITRWEFVKKRGYEAFFLDSNIGYPNFYKYRYKPMENDFKLFIAGGDSVNKELFFKEERRNAFWGWFLRTYLRDNVYPTI